MTHDFVTLVHRPFKHYADFSGRSGRAEFWIFILTAIILMKVVSVATFSLLYLADYDHDYQAQYHSHATGGSLLVGGQHSSASEQQDPSDRRKQGIDDVVLEIHRHVGLDGYHLHIRQSDPAASEDKPHHYDGLLQYKRYQHPAPSHRFQQRIMGLAGLIFALPLLTVGVRRLHDTGKSGWWWLFILIPVAGWLVLAIFFTLPGEADANKYGPAVYR